MVRKKRSCRHGEEMSRCSSFRWPEDKTATEELEPGGDSPEAVSEDGAALEEERGIEEAEGRRGNAGKNGESRKVGLGGACVLLSFAGFGPLDTRLERLRSTSQEAGSRNESTSPY
jgi:hypothetical protein